jgi:hypothetical protein
MSTLPPLPPEIQAKLNQTFPEVVDALDVFVTALRSDPKRDPDNLPDYHNTVTAMLLEAEQQNGADFNRALAALAFIELADAGWKPPERGDIPGIDIEAKPRRRRGRLKRRPRRNK